MTLARLESPVMARHVSISLRVLIAQMGYLYRGTAMAGIRTHVF